MEIKPQEIINALFEPEDEVCIRVFDDKKTGTFPGKNYCFKAVAFPSVIPELEKHNSLGRGIFFVVNSGGHTDSSITRINAQFMEMDEGSFEEQLEKIEAFPLQPSMIIKTRKSLHTYYFMDSDAKPEKFKPLQLALAKHFKADTACSNLSRVMRLPGFNHCKQEPVPVRCISFHPERRYSQRQLEECLPEIEEKNRRISTCGSDRGLELMLNSCSFFDYCRENAKTLSEPLWFAMLSNLSPFSGGAEAAYVLSAPYPGYTKTETRKKLESIMRSGAGPVCCETIANLGYSCPKLLSGECRGAAPAALSKRAADISALRKIVSGLPISQDVLENVGTAEKFVENCLFNQERLIAEMLINEDLKKKFSFKKDCTALIIAHYRGIAPQKIKSCKKKEEEDVLPEWYQHGNAGLKFMPGLLAERLAATQNVFYAAEQYYRYSGGVYRQMNELEAEKIVRSFMISKETKSSQIADTEHQWRLLCQKSLRNLNPNPYLINLKNGLYDLAEEKLVPHSPDFYSTIQLNAAYDEAAECPLFISFLKESMNGDEKQVALIQEILGYLLIPVTSAQKAFVLVGAAGAGKSVLLRVINELLLGTENVSNVAWQALNERFKPAELFGKLANTFADLPTKNIDDNGIFKSLVGEDSLTVERKNRDPFSFRSTARLIFSCNSIPRNYGDKSEGFYRRLIIIRYVNPVAPEKRDPELFEKLRSETDGILMFALEGLKRLVENAFVFSETETNREELQRYRQDSDSVAGFTAECCLLGEEFICGSTELYNLYESYCEESGMKPCAQRTFISQLQANCPEITRGTESTGKRRILKGIKPAQVYI